MIETLADLRHGLALEAARHMATAAATAPKGKGADDVEIAIVAGPELEQIAQEMERMAASMPNASFLRDAGNIRQAEAVVLIAARRMPLGLNCGYCGAATCGKKAKDAACVFNTVDLGIAIGSAAARAADCRVDTRVMYTAGLAAARLGLIDARPAFALPVSVTAKNPFFDRKTPSVPMPE